MWPFLSSPPLGQPHSVFGGASACRLLSSFHNLPKSDMDYRIFNVRTWSFVCVRIHTGLGTPTASQHYLFDLKFLLVLLTGFEPWSLDLQPNVLTTEPTRHPHLVWSHSDSICTFSPEGISFLSFDLYYIVLLDTVSYHLSKVNSSNLLLTFIFRVELTGRLQMTV